MSIDTASVSNRRQSAATRIVEERRRAAQAMLESADLVEDVLGKEDEIRRASFVQSSSHPSQQGDRENKPPNAFTNWDAATAHSKSSDLQTMSTRSSAHQQQSQPRGGQSRERQRSKLSPGRSSSLERSNKPASKERRQSLEPPAPTPPPAKQKKSKSEEVEKKKGGGLFGIFGRGRDKSGAHKESKEKQLKGPPTNLQPSVTRNPSPPVQPLSKTYPSPSAESVKSHLSPPAKLVIATSPTRSSARDAQANDAQRSSATLSPTTARSHLKAPPKNLRPGQSYKSSPNSAEIVVRTSLIQMPNRPEPPVSGRQIRSPANNRSPLEKQSRTPTLFSFSGRQDPDGSKDPPIGNSFSLAEDPPESPSTLGVAPSTSMDSYTHAQLEAPPSFSMDFVPHKKGRDPSLASVADDRTMRDSESGLLVVSTTSASLDGSTGDVLVHRLGRLVSDTTFSGSQQSSTGPSNRSKLAGERTIPSPAASVPSRGDDVTDEMLADRPMPEPVDSMEVDDDDDFMELPAPPSNIGTQSFESQLQPSVSRRDDLSALRAVSMLDPSDSTSSSSASPRSATLQEMVTDRLQLQSVHLQMNPSKPALEVSCRPAHTADSGTIPQQTTKVNASPKHLPSNPQERLVGASDLRMQSAGVTSEPTPVAVHLHAFAEIVVAPDEVSAITDPSYRKRDQSSATHEGLLAGMADIEDTVTLGHTKGTDQTSAASDDPVVARSDVSDPYEQIFSSDSPSNKSIDPFTEPFFKATQPPQLLQARKPDPEVLDDEDDIAHSLEIALTRTDTERGSSLTGAVEHLYHIESGYISAASTEEEEKKADDEVHVNQKKKIGWESKSSECEHILRHESSENQGRPPLIETTLSYSSAGASGVEQVAMERARITPSMLQSPPTPRLAISIQKDLSRQSDSVHSANPSPTAATVVDHRAPFPAREHVNRLSSLQVATSSASLSRSVPPSPETPTTSVLIARTHFLSPEQKSKKGDVAVGNEGQHASLYSRATLKLTSHSMSPRQRRRAKAGSPKTRTSLDSMSLKHDAFAEDLVSEPHQDHAKHPSQSFSPKQQALKKLADPKPKRRPMFASMNRLSTDHQSTPATESAQACNGQRTISAINGYIEKSEAEHKTQSTTTTSYLAKLKGGRKARLAARARSDTVERIEVAQHELRTDLLHNMKQIAKTPARNRLGLLEEAKKNPGAVRSKKSHRDKPKEITGAAPVLHCETNRRPVTDVVAKGLSIKSNKRKIAIAQGRAVPVVLKPKHKIEPIDTRESPLSIDKLIKDPIQRAGFRLLSKAAIPIQATVRRYLAQREAVDRMWALIEIQSYCRRWKCEAFKLAHTYSATRIQAAFRGWRDRDTLEDHHFCATQIQKVIRGYLVFTFVREILKRVPLVQAQIRGFIAKRIAADRLYAIILIQAVVRSHLSRVFVTKMRAAASIQRIARGILARKEATQRRAAATVIQATWRSFSTRLMFQLDFVDIITVQSIVRRWLACKRKYEMNMEQRKAAAIKIQAAWRGYHDYTLYIFSMADIIVVQRAFRMWQAKMKVDAMRRQKKARVLNYRMNSCATTIQSFWRRFAAQSEFVSQLVNIILIQVSNSATTVSPNLQLTIVSSGFCFQSMARRYLARKLRFHVADWKILRIRAACSVQKWRRMILFRRSLKVHRAATKIQTLWRGFWQYTHYIIVQYEIVRVQALVRGNLARNCFGMRLGCAIIIQATGRQFLARKRVRSLRTAYVLVRGASLAIRESIACRKIQILWRHLRRLKIEKAAGLVIERFFLMVKEEVDREIRRREKRRTSKSKREKRRRHKKEPEDKILERAWLNTVDENKVDEFAYPMNSDSKSIGAESRSKSAPRLRNTFSTESGVSFHPSVVSNGKASTVVSQKKHVTLRDDADVLVNQRSSDDSDVSGLTNPTYRFAHRSRQTALTQKELSDDLSLEEAFLDVQAHHTKQKRKTVDDYIQKYGLQKSMTIKSHASAHTRVSIESRVTSMSRASAASRRFFPDEIETPRSTNPGAGSPSQTTRPHSSGNPDNSTANTLSQKNPLLRIGPATRMRVGTGSDNDKYASSIYPSSSSVSSSDAGFNAYDADQPPKLTAAMGTMDQARVRYLPKSAPGRPNLELYSSSSSPRDDNSFYRIESA
jgi:hypothetical protein